METLISFVSASLICFAIPCASARNCERPPTIAYTIRRFPSLVPSGVGCTDFHLSRCLYTASLTVSQGRCSCVLFPIHAPSECIASPSFMMWTSSRVVRSFGFSFLKRITLFLWFLVPIGIISVFSLLNFAPDTPHNLSSVFRVASERAHRHCVEHHSSIHPKWHAGPGRVRQDMFLSSTYSSKLVASEEDGV
jgi:hypothetical protein